MTLYITQQGDMLDDIAFKTYGDATLITFILKANPGLVDQPLILAYGIPIQLPDAPVKPVQNTLQTVWG